MDDEDVSDRRAVTEESADTIQKLVVDSVNQELDQILSNLDFGTDGGILFRPLR